MALTTSILDSIKLMVGIQIADTSFDNVIMLHINSVFMILHQLGVGTEDVYAITGKTEEWDDFLASGDDAYLALAKSYMALKVQSYFDPPTSGVVTDSNKRVLEEMEYRLAAQVEVRPEA